MDSLTAGDSCGEGCAQLDDFNWFLPADDRVGDLPAPESQVDLSDGESDVEDVEPDLAPVADDDDDCLGQLCVLDMHGGHTDAPTRRPGDDPQEKFAALADVAG